MFNKNNAWLWLTWAIFTVGLTVFFAMKLNSNDADKTVFLPGTTTHGHHQIEMACNACHSQSFTDQDVMQEACVNCHGEALAKFKDKHPKSKFTDPRNADRVEILDARYCVTCHVEHRPDMTHDMGVTMPMDYCHLCHEDIAEDRPSHEGMAFDTCASAGCHNYHDNQALYEDFLVKHLHEPNVLEKQERLPELNLEEVAPLVPGYPYDDYPITELALENMDAPASASTDATLNQDWFETTHAKSGVNCTACHQQTIDEAQVWVDKPTQAACQSCHSEQLTGFLQGKHGMRMDSENLKMELTAMTPSMARLPMKKDAHDTSLNCNSCHEAHRFDTKQARVEQCLTCHNDEHSLAYIDSPHHELWKKELAGELPENAGVTCATCHMPRVEKDFFDGEFYMGHVQHNQNETLKPNEKMIRPVCMNCHGLEFTIDALADKALSKNNYSSAPSVHIKSMELAEIRMIEAEEKKRRLRAQEKQNQ